MLGVVGYLSFCGSVTDDVLASLPHVPGVAVARVALVVQLSVALPLRFHVVRNVVIEELALEAPTRAQESGVVAAVVALALVVAAKLRALHLALGLTSAVGASCIIYILPGLAHLAHARRSNPAPAAPPLRALLLLLVGLFVLVFGTATNVLALLRGTSAPGGG
mmetsp:Transcript_7113/g.23575  ORF Transcript_7113/g.23575 Transcript_7113/m.23575 type:complete len:164 (+) Transcript_7113:126-617(+)